MQPVDQGWIEKHSIVGGKKVYRLEWWIWYNNEVEIFLTR